MSDYIKTALDLLENSDISISDLVIGLLSDRRHRDHPIVTDLVAHSSNVLSAFLLHPAASSDEFECRAIIIANTTYLQELRNLASEDSGWHFGVSSATTQQLEGFSLKNMAQQLEEQAPKWWGLIGTLLGHHEGSTSTVTDNSLGVDEDAGGCVDSAEEENYWNDLDEVDIEDLISGVTGTTEDVARSTQKHQERVEKRRSSIKVMKKIVICCILMQGINQKANTLQSVLGIFLQSVHAPQKVVDTLARLGISVSTDAINLAIRALSAESLNTIGQLGQSLLASYAYDNFDIDLKSQVPLAEKSNDSLKHLTSGLLFPLVHGVTTDDLRCSEELWNMSHLNLHADEHNMPKRRTWRDLVTLYPDSPLPNGSQLSRHDRFNSWMFLRDLCTYGPECFRQFTSMISDPESVEMIPLVKTPIFAARAMDINNSTVSGNIRAVVELLKQGGINDPHDTANQADTDSTSSGDMSQHVVLIHGDLGTGERLQAAQLRRSIEETPWDRLQHVIFIPGLFHLKMACADAIWRCFIQPPLAREDATSLMHDLAEIRPRETGIYASKPGFRRMHEAISHTGIARRLDCWRVHIQDKYPQFTSLETYAATEPSLGDLKEIADEMVHTFIATHELQRTRRKPIKERDMQFENAQLLNKYCLLYEELSFAMNRGDIGRVEACIISWIPILKAVGKHKYATHMTSFLLNVHFVYPPGLRHAIRYHILVNPTGRPMKWRAVDWIVELNNLFTKVKNGGKGSNRTVEQIILESPLVNVYRNIQEKVQQSFEHTHLLTNHAAPDMTKTFKKLLVRLAGNSPHAKVLGRKTGYMISNLNDKGREMMEKVEQGEGETKGNVVDEVGSAEPEDIIVELL